MPVNKERIENVEIDINDTSLADGEQHEIDAKEDWQARACPPPEAIYALKILPGKFEQGTKQGFGKDDPNGKYYVLKTTGKIQDPSGKWDNAVVDVKMSTGIPRGKKTSTMAGLMVMGKVKLEGKRTDLALAKLCDKWLTQKEPVIYFQGVWEVWDASNKDDIKMLKKGMTSFPRNPDGTYSHVVKNKVGEECYAKLKVGRWIGVAGSDALKEALAKANKASSKPNGAVVSKPATATATKKEEVVEASSAVEGALDFGEDGEVVLDA